MRRIEIMDDKKKQKLAYIWALLTVIVTCIVGALVANYSDQNLPVFLGCAAVLFGPITGILYLVEVKRGVFKVEEEEK